MILSHKKARKSIKIMSIDEINQLCDTIRESSFGLHKHLRHGHLEKIYENGLAHRLKKKES